MRTDPCESCPYRRDSKPGQWAPQNFDNLVLQDHDSLTGSVFGCHGTRKTGENDLCVGWVLDQKKRGCPSMQLRVAMVMEPEVGELMEKATDGGHELYDSVQEMVAAQESLGRCKGCDCYLSAQSEDNPPKDFESFCSDICEAGYGE